MAPTLHAHKWLNIDGSYPSIVGLVNLGVAKPKAHPEVMPPRGGADLSPGDVCAVGADVYSMSHPTAAFAASTSAAPRRGAVAPAAGASAAGAPAGAASQRLASRSAAAPPVAVPPAAPAPPGAPQVRTVSNGALTITFKGTPENYTIRVDNPDGRTSSTYTFSAQAAPPPPQESTAAAPAMAAAPVRSVPGAADSVAGATAPAAGATAPQAPGCPPIAPALVAEGRKVFTGGGNCYACHGDNATGTPMAPTLHAHAWLDSDGSYASIVQLVTNGVATPKAHPAPMPPRGGGQVTGPQVCAVAAYVYSLSH